jgi:small-conductance mechanosensitive channel
LQSSPTQQTVHLLHPSPVRSDRAWAKVGCALRRVLAMITVLFMLPIAHAALAETSPPAEVRELLKLLDDPVVRGWLQANQPPPQGPAPQPSPPPPPTPASNAAETSPAEFLSDRLTRIRRHLAGLSGAVQRIPDEAQGAAGRAAAEFKSRSFYGTILLVIAFAGLGFGFEAIYRRAIASSRRALAGLPLNSFAERGRVHMLRLALALGRVASFGIGSIGAFLLFDWPPLLRETVLAVLLAVLAACLGAVVLGFLLDPSPIRRMRSDTPFRLIPMSDEAARFWYARSLLFVGYFAAGYAVVMLMRTHGFSREVSFLAAYTLGLGLLAIAIEATWRRPIDAPEGSTAERRRAGDLLITFHLVLLWLTWVTGALGLFWIGVYVVFLPKAIKLGGTVARTVIGREATPSSGQTSIAAVLVERGVRASLLIMAALWLAYVLEINPDTLQAQDTLVSRIGRGVAASVVILLLADLIWQLGRAGITRALARIGLAEGLSAAESARRSRLRTLLPILRNMLLVVVLVTSVLMVLSSLGIEIGPLIAGAGVIGVAIGFGSQTLVKDIISGVFYMLDDAFRVGEYIQSGTYKGTVESFSLRSVKLRHHRGPVYTVPFGSLGAVQNMSRDWVIDKFVVRVVYDTDLAKVKKIIKAIGAELAADPEFSPFILETLKMQGVDQFGEFAIDLRFKMMTKPGEQFAIRRRAFALIKQAFAESGIQFALPTVQIAGPAADAGRLAAAKEALDLVKKPEAAE